MRYSTFSLDRSLNLGRCSRFHSLFRLYHRRRDCLLGPYRWRLFRRLVLSRRS